jgi:hypothetical protein
MVSVARWTTSTFSVVPWDGRPAGSGAAPPVVHPRGHERRWIPRLLRIVRRPGDSYGLSALVSAQRQSHLHELALRIINPSTPVGRLLTVCSHVGFPGATHVSVGPTDHRIPRGNSTVQSSSRSAHAATRSGNYPLAGDQGVRSHLTMNVGAQARKEHRRWPIQPQSRPTVARISSSTSSKRACRRRRRSELMLAIAPRRSSCPVSDPPLASGSS